MKGGRKSTSRIDKTGFSPKSCNHPNNLWKKRYAELYKKYQLEKYGEKTLEITGYMQLVNYPKVSTHKGMEEAAGNIIKWSGGTVIDTPTVGTPRFEKKLVGGKLEQVMVGYNRAKGGKGKQDHIWVINGKVWFIDFKVGADYQKEAQVKFQKRLEKAGGTYMLIHNPDEIFALLDEINLQQSLF